MREKTLNLSLFLFYLNFGNGCSRQASPSGQPAIREGAMNERPAETEDRFQQAKNAAQAPQFLQNVAKPKRAAARDRREAKPEPKLTRVAFKVSRLTEFCSEKELTAQIGHSAWDWPLVVAKELIDNALDAAEEAEVAPSISVTVEKDTIIIEDNAGGMDAETITSVLDYTVRVSSREAYVSPTRGAQGNALKTILAMGYVLSKYVDGAATAGVTIIEARGVKHRIEFQVDHVNNQPKIVRRTSASPVTIGTRITRPSLRWDDAVQLVLDDTALDRVLAEREKGKRSPATSPAPAKTMMTRRTGSCSLEQKEAEMLANEGKVEGQIEPQDALDALRTALEQVARETIGDSNDNGHGSRPPRPSGRWIACFANGEPKLTLAPHGSGTCRMAERPALVHIPTSTLHLRRPFRHCVRRDCLREMREQARR
jgi:hypothetical protein